MEEKIKLIYHNIKTLFRLNIVRTIYFNFKMLPLGKALKFPIHLYGRIFFGGLSGQIILPEHVSYGMIRIGYKWIDLWPLSFCPTQIQVLGKLEFMGNSIISGGANINVQSNCGILIIGNNSVIGGGSVVKCLNHITIGDNTGITGNCNIMDCNMHFVKNIETGIVKNYMAPIVIGRNCWINYGTIIAKGSVIPDYSITARNTYVSGDFSDQGSNVFLVGSPAKTVKGKYQRIFSKKKQDKIAKQFLDEGVDEIYLKTGIEIEDEKREGF